MEQAVLDQVKELLSQLENDVTLYVFTKKDHCLLCNQVLELITLISDLNPKLHVQGCQCDLEDEMARVFRIERHPAVVIHGPSKRNVRFFGIPSGFEFRSFIDSILDSSRGSTVLSPETRENLRNLNLPVHIEVFVTPTCPYCPMAVRIAHKFAIESEMITSDMIESLEFVEYAQEFNVMSVPRTIINKEISIEGAVLEPILLQKVLEAAKK